MAKFGRSGDVLAAEAVVKSGEELTSLEQLRSMDESIGIYPEAPDEAATNEAQAGNSASEALTATTKALTASTEALTASTEALTASTKALAATSKALTAVTLANTSRLWPRPRCIDLSSH